MLLPGLALQTSRSLQREQALALLAGLLVPVLECTTVAFTFWMEVLCPSSPPHLFAIKKINVGERQKQ